MDRREDTQPQGREGDVPTLRLRASVLGGKTYLVPNKQLSDTFMPGMFSGQPTTEGGSTKVTTTTHNRRPLHQAVSSGDLRSLAFLVGNMNNAVGRIVEGGEYRPEPRPPLDGGDAESKVKLLRILAEQLDFVAEAIENDEEA